MKIEKKLIIFILNNMIWLMLIGVILLFAALLPSFFLTLRNFKTMFWISSRFAFIAFAEAIVLIGGNFDLSVGQMTGFVAMVTAIIMTTVGSGMPWYLGIIVLLFISTLCGAVNGFFVGKLKFNAFLFTL
jgi:ribose transport system permease protein